MALKPRLLAEGSGHPAFRLLPTYSRQLVQDLVSFLVEQFPLGTLSKEGFQAGIQRGRQVNWELPLLATGCAGVSVPAAPVDTAGVSS